MGQRGSREESAQESSEITWWFRYLTKGVGVLAGLLSMVLGIFVCVTITGRCILAGVLQVLYGFGITIMEAPCCCQCLDYVDRIGKFSDNRPPWQKAVVYCLFPVLPVAICIEVSTFVGCGSIFVTGALYGLMALGKKADLDTMKARAVTGEDQEMTVTLVKEEEKSHSYTSLPTFTGDP